ncbi:hypothetical protein [Alteromonas sp. KUL49]|uniref:hypothetical protein n=1 Tax=Alteromonas sp. KUL49 TaxID=2480798 RepID=UPI00102EF6B7|nr:hypothetical protein [Alteromonas sp. KUL49]TAP38745.1 hypothetical protein EYS00_15190 [Alteromonas sp. KUL49]GEA12700.1 hypothetical protein KUL49_30750 [Alteromonas sp. KUL49]
MLSKQIIVKANLARNILENMLFNTPHDKEIVLTDQDKQDLTLVLRSCEELADLGKTVEEMVQETVSAIR